MTRLLATIAVAVSAVLLTLGALTTSFKAGMADPVWPTEPWYLVVNGHVWQEARAGFLLEHTHRLAGWVIGGVMSLLALSAWAGDHSRGSRRFGLVAVLSLLVVYGQFHREMGRAWAARTAGDGVTVWPAVSGWLTLAAVLVLLAAAAVTTGPGRWVRRLASVSLVAVMAQGLLGGYRVYLDQLLGVQLAAVHGTFAQVVLCLLLATRAMTRPARFAPGQEAARLTALTLLLPVAVVLQLVWGALVRHTGSPLMQRLHLLTAFVVAGLVVFLAARVLVRPDCRRALGGAVFHLLGIVGLQVALGVEAWMGKFAATGPQAGVVPALRSVTVEAGTLRSAHAVVGAALLASAVLLALRVWRRAEWPERATAASEQAAVAAAA